MSSIFDKTDNQFIVSRINNLNSDSQALWGKMSVDQMLKHANETIIVAFGETEVKVNFVLRFLGRILKKNAFNKGFGKNSPTAKEFIFTEHYDFNEVKTELIKNFSRLPKATNLLQ